MVNMEGLGEIAEAATSELGEQQMEVEEDVVEVLNNEIENAEIGEADIPPENPGIIKYTANGQEFEADLEKAKEALSQLEANRKWTGEKAKLVKKYKQLEKEAKDAKELEKYKQSWEYLDKIKHDPKKLFSTLTGQDYDKFLEREFAKRDLMKNGSDEVKRILRQEEEIAELKRKMEEDVRLKEELAEKAKKESEQAERLTMRGKMEAEFRKYNLEGVEPSIANRLKKMLWKQSAGDLKDYLQKYGKLTDKMYQKAFADNAAALKQFQKQEVDKGVNKILEGKKKSAQEKAQVAATKNYSEADYRKMDPMSLFKALTGRK